MIKISEKQKITKELIEYHDSCNDTEFLKTYLKQALTKKLVESLLKSNAITYVATPTKMDTYEIEASLYVCGKKESDHIKQLEDKIIALEAELSQYKKKTLLR